MCNCFVCMFWWYCSVFFEVYLYFILVIGDVINVILLIEIEVGVIVIYFINCWSEVV